MAQYRDTAGKVHPVRISIAARQRILDSTEWDVLEMAHNPQRLSEFLAAIQLDDTLIYEVLAAIEQAPSATLMEAADGSTHEEASTALLEALADFFPKGSPMKTGLQDLKHGGRSASRSRQRWRLSIFNRWHRLQRPRRVADAAAVHDRSGSRPADTEAGSVGCASVSAAGVSAARVTDGGDVQCAADEAI
jgi:hypothetical protein